MDRRAYLMAAIILFAIEVLIALFVRDDFIRPCIGARPLMKSANA